MLTRRQTLGVLGMLPVAGGALATVAGGALAYVAEGRAAGATAAQEIR